MRFLRACLCLCLFWFSYKVVQRVLSISTWGCGSRELIGGAILILRSSLCRVLACAFARCPGQCVCHEYVQLCCRLQFHRLPEQHWLGLGEDRVVWVGFPWFPLCGMNSVLVWDLANVLEKKLAFLFCLTFWVLVSTYCVILGYFSTNLLLIDDLKKIVLWMSHL